LHSICLGRVQGEEKRLINENYKLTESLHASEHERSKLLKQIDRMHREKDDLAQQINVKSEKLKSEEEIKQRLRKMNWKLTDEVKCLAIENEKLKKTVSAMEEKIFLVENEYSSPQTGLKEEECVDKTEAGEELLSVRRDNEEIRRAMTQLKDSLLHAERDNLELTKQNKHNALILKALNFTIDQIDGYIKLKEEGFWTLMYKNGVDKDMMEVIRFLIKEKDDSIMKLNSKISEDSRLIQRLTEQNNEQTETIGDWKRIFDDLEKRFTAAKEDSEILKKETSYKEKMLQILNLKNEEMEERIQLLQDFANEMKDLQAVQAKKRKAENNYNLEDMIARIKLLDDFGEKMKIKVANQEAKKSGNMFFTKVEKSVDETSKFNKKRKFEDCC